VTLTPETLAAYIAIAVAAASGISTVLGHWLRRRAASGRVETSEAAVLWQQSQDIRNMLMTEKARAEEQRDRLIEAYTVQVLPVLAETKEAVLSLTATVQDMVKLITENRVLLEEVGRGTARTLAPASESQEGG
jgi:hypothetical protein